MPLDKAETQQIGPGIYVLEGPKHCRQYDPLFDGPGTPRRMNHWATCPKKDQFKRKPKPKARPME